MGVYTSIRIAPCNRAAKISALVIMVLAVLTQRERENHLALEESTVRTRRPSFARPVNSRTRRPKVDATRSGEATTGFRLTTRKGRRQKKSAWLDTFVWETTPHRKRALLEKIR